MSTIEIRTGVYIANNTNGYWKATAEQEQAWKNFPESAYTGMGSSNWMTISEAREKVTGIKNKYDMVMKFDGTRFIKTSDGRYRHIFEIKYIPYTK